MILALISLLLLVLYAFLIGFYHRQWKRVKTHGPTASEPVGIAVVVAARNEEATLQLLLQDLQQQDYPAGFLEVILVDDYSTDGTALLGKDLPPHFRMIQPAGTTENSSKKKAIAAGVAAATKELILVTDADCRVGKNWVATHAGFYRQTGASFVAAPVRYTYQPTLLQVLQTLDFITLQGITAAGVSANFGMMCNGANLAYTKKAFDAVGGFENIDNIPTGDDMLLMHKIWKREPDKIAYLKSNKAIVSTAAVQTWREFIMQRRRWASKTRVYEDKRLIAVLGFVLLLNLFPFVLLVAGFFASKALLILFFFLLLKGLIEWPFVASVARFFSEQKLMRYFMLLQPLHVFYTVFVGVSSQFGTYTWKGRKASSFSSKEGISAAKPLHDQDTSLHGAPLIGGEPGRSTSPLESRGTAG
jgi:cellulose synthase/poly-beta-1,6-N-acetylglucosamine synthase-like glycosyltransferase